MTIAVGEANKAIDAYVGKATYTANSALWVKLHLGDPGAAGTSNAAAETTRKQMTAAAAATGQISNSGALLWSAVAATENVTWVSFWTASSGGTYLGSVALNATAGLTAGNNFQLAANQLVVTWANTEWAVGEANKALDAWCGNTTYTANAAFCAKLHIGDPGSAGTNNAAGETTRKAVAFANNASAGSTANTAAVTWTSVSTAETETWFSYWSATSGGTFLGRDDVTDVALIVGDDLTVAIGGVVVTAG
jgi:hypothetical protein